MYENLNMWDRAEKIFNDNREEIINLYEDGIMPCMDVNHH
jgi:hypothetical protein